MKTAKKILLYLAITLGVLLISFVLSVFLFKEKILQQFIAEANKSLNTPVKIGKMDVSAFSAFPQLSIVLTDVYVEDSHPGEYPLLTAKTISFTLSPFEVWQGNYTIKGIQISDSETNLKINVKGQANFNILKENPDEKKQATGTLKFALKDVELINTRVRYLDIKARQDLAFDSKELKASIESEGQLYLIEGTGELRSILSINGNTYLSGKSFNIDSHLAYDNDKRSFIIKPSQLKLKESEFTVEGSYQWKTKISLI